MAVMQIFDVRNWQCLSTDSVVPSDDGSTLHYIDTGEQFISHGGMWVPDQRWAYIVKSLYK